MSPGAMPGKGENEFFRRIGLNCAAACSHTRTQFRKERYSHSYARAEHEVAPRSEGGSPAYEYAYE